MSGALEVRFGHLLALFILTVACSLSALCATFMLLNREYARMATLFQGSRGMAPWLVGLGILWLSSSSVSLIINTSTLMPAYVLLLFYVLFHGHVLGTLWSQARGLGTGRKLLIHLTILGLGVGVFIGSTLLEGWSEGLVAAVAGIVTLAQVVLIFWVLRGQFEGHAYWVINTLFQLLHFASLLGLMAGPAMGASMLTLHYLHYVLLALWLGHWNYMHLIRPLQRHEIRVRLAQCEDPL